ncbi:MAG: hypothetical protein DMG59_09145 [Acidobacteria bacterium]|nr:MAG: hypothetical protein DMG59_09145 [Acidobacteriota bacterium]
MQHSFCRVQMPLLYSNAVRPFAFAGGTAEQREAVGAIRRGLDDIVDDLSEAGPITSAQSMGDRLDLRQSDDFLDFVAHFL